MALAAQEFSILNEIGLTNVGARLLQDKFSILPKKPHCKDRAKVPGDGCYFKSVAYMAKSGESKMADLWKEILVDDEPMDYYWTEFPNIFT